MKKHLILVSAVLITCCFLAMTTVAIFAEDDSQTVALSDAPAAVQKTVQAQAAGGTMGDISKYLYAGEMIYDVEFTATNDVERDFRVAEDGTVLTVEVPLAEMSTNAQSAIKSLVGDGSLEEIDENLDDTETNYDVVFTNKVGQEKTDTIADDGTLESAEVALSETPDAVNKKITAQIADGKLESVDENFEDATNYDVTFTTKDGREDGFTVELDGSLSSEQVVLDEIPAPAQKTIKNQIGDGKILRVDKSFVKEKGVLPFVVLGRKDGRPFNFSVGPRGRFLGMDY